MRRLCYIPAVVILLCGMASCDSGSSPSASFDRGPLLQNWSANIIVPAYDTLAERSLRLKDATEQFTQAPGAGTLAVLREAWLSAYVAFQHVGFYNFGPADQYLLNTALNTFPTSKNEVEANVSSGSYDLQAVSNNDAKGFSALDYQLYGLAADDTEILAFYTSDTDAENRKQYLLDITADIYTRAVQIYEAWTPAGDDYSATFVSRTGIDVGSSIGMVINAAVQYLETNLRDAKIGIPLGVRSLNVPIPANCEALHAEQSILLAVESATALQNLYLGKAAADGVGLDDNLAAINARYNGGALDDAIRAQLALVITKLSAIPEPYAETVENNQVPPTEAYQELQKLTLLLKTDMTSSLGVLITYQDNDGD